jgi:serine/threonine protein kinase
MLLHSHSSTGRKATSQKFRLPCQSRVTNNETTKEWLTITKKLADKHPVLLGILDKKKDIVVKYGNVDTIQHEYTVSEALAVIPNMIKYYCVFSCKDNIELIGHKPTLCDASGHQQIGYIVMPYYPMKDLNGIEWKRSDFDNLRNIMTQACFAVLYAFEKFRFVHTDLHLYNVLIRKTQKQQLSYGTVVLPVTGYYAIIMDFERSMLPGHSVDMYRSLHRMLSLVPQLEKSDIVVSVDLRLLDTWMSENTIITPKTYQQIKSIIDNMTILYEISKRPPNPFI